MEFIGSRLWGFDTKVGVCLFESAPRLTAGPYRSSLLLGVHDQKYPHYEFYVDQEAVSSLGPRRLSSPTPRPRQQQQQQQRRRRSSSPAQQPLKVEPSQDLQQDPEQQQPKQQQLQQPQLKQQQLQQQPRRPKQQQQQLQARADFPAIPEKGDLDEERHRPLDRKAWAAGQEVIRKIRFILESENVPHRGVLKRVSLPFVIRFAIPFIIPLVTPFIFRQPRVFLLLCLMILLADFASRGL